MKRTFIIALSLFVIYSNNVNAQRQRVQIKNGTIVTDEQTLLRGVYIETAYTSQLPSRAEIRKIKELGLNCIHLYAECPELQTAGDRSDLVDILVDWTEQDSLYLILNIGGCAYNGAYDSTFVYDFWKFYAPRYKNKTHLIYEIVNEPYGWSAPYDAKTIEMERWSYALIRKLAPETHIQLMSYAQAINVDDVLDDVRKLKDDVDWSNASIASHGYYTAPENLRSFIRTIKDAGYAISFTEPQSIRDRIMNLATTRIFEQEFVSYCHFISLDKLVNDSSVYINRVLQSELRWTPDFGTWPQDIKEISYVNPYNTVLGLYYDGGYGFKMMDRSVEYYLGTIQSGDYIGFYNLNFTTSPDNVYITYSSPSSYENFIEVRLDSFDGLKIGQQKVENTGGWFSYQTSTVGLASAIKGVNRIFFVPKGVNWDFLTFKDFRFSKTDLCETFTLSGEAYESEYNKNTGAINLIVEGGKEPYEYGWSNGAVTKNLTDLMDGEYSVWVTDANNCQLSASYTVGVSSYVDPCLSFDVRGKAINADYQKSNGSIALKVFGGQSPFFYNWSDGSTDKYRNDLNAGVYSVKVTDINGCNKDLSFEVQEDPMEFKFLRMYPNPTDGLFATEFMAPSSGDVEILVKEESGGVVISKSISVKKGYNKTTLYLFSDNNQELPDGLYKVYFSKGEESFSYSVIKR